MFSGVNIAEEVVRGGVRRYHNSQCRENLGGYFEHILNCCNLGINELSASELKEFYCNLYRILLGRLIKPMTIGWTWYVACMRYTGYFIRKN
jgi:hypothetical protein